MPIFFQQEIDADTKLGVWKIKEPEEFFLREVMPQRNVSHPHKKLQHLAGRFLLKYLFKDFPAELIQIADTRKPFLEDEAYHFSISHCGNYSAAVVSTTKRVGVDVELISEKAARIRHKFLSKEELAMGNRQWAIDNSEHERNFSTVQLINLSTLLWSCKEAVFKWYGLGGINFKEDIIIKSIIPVDENTLETIILFKKNEDLYLDIHSIIFDEVCLSWVAT
ncbi:MAG: 4'-phosphopantetheinyl transferase superfamily protein [Chitinophagaceae bacterium]